MKNKTPLHYAEKKGEIMNIIFIKGTYINVTDISFEIKIKYY